MSRSDEIKEQSRIIKEEAREIVERHLSPEADNFDLLLEIAASRYHFNGPEQTELYVKRMCDDHLRKTIGAFEDHLRERLGVKDKFPYGDGDDIEVHHFDFNGHFNTKSGVAHYVNHRLCLLDVDEGLPQENLELVLEFMKDPTVPLPRWIALDDEDILSQCPTCGIYPQLETDGLEVRIRGACEYPEGIPPWTVEVDFPTGVLMVHDDLRPWFRDAYKRVEGDEEVSRSVRYYERESRMDFDINHTRGVVNTSREYAKDGYLTSLIGNTNPTVYQDPQDPGRVLIGQPRVLDEREWITEDTLDGCVEVDSIGTDLWWYSIAELAHLEATTPLFRQWNKESGEMFLGPNEKEDQVVGFQLVVPPGRYRATNHYHIINRQEWESDEDDYGPKLYTEIVRIGDCEGGGE